VVVDDEIVWSSEEIVWSFEGLKEYGNGAVFVAVT